MKHQQWGQFALASPPKSDPDEVAYGVLRQPRRGWMCEKFYRLQSREKNALLTSPSIGLPSWVFKVNLQTRFVTHKG